MSDAQVRAGTATGAGAVRRAWSAFAGRSLGRSFSAMLGWLLLAFFLFVAAFGPLLTAADPLRQDPGSLLPIGSPGHLLGTDDLGRDELARLIYGARPLIVVALVATLLAALVGVAVGLIAGFAGGWVDQFLMRTTDLALAFPAILLVILVVTIAGAGTTTLVIGVGVAMAPGLARLARALTARESARDYVLAARVGGARTPRILLVEILPNILGTVGVQLVSTVSIAAGFAAGLSYLGLGIQPPQPDWGYMVQAAQQFVYNAPRLVTMPALCTLIFVVACNFVGDDVQAASNRRRS